MLFLCRDKERFISVEPPRTVVHHSEGRVIEEHVAGKSILFTPLAEGDKIFPGVLPIKFGITHPAGHFRSEDASSRKGLTQKEAERWLADHKDYGQEFVAIGQHREVLGSNEWDDPAKRSEGYLTPSGDGMFCQLCERQLPNRGLGAHLRSKKHVGYLEKAEEKNLPKYVEADE